MRVCPSPTAAPASKANDVAPWRGAVHAYQTECAGRPWAPNRCSPGSAVARTSSTCVTPVAPAILSAAAKSSFGGGAAKAMSAAGTSPVGTATDVEAPLPFHALAVK